MDCSFWRNKKVLITGHTGFKGSWLTLLLRKLGAKIVGFSLAPPTQPNLFTLANIKEKVISLTGDVCDFNALSDVFLTHQPEIVFHMAAQPLVRYSYEQPVETYSTNVMGTVNLLEIARRVNVTKAIVNVTSDKCYANKEYQRGYHEKDELGGHDPYSNSKACAELITSAFRNSFYNNSKNICGLASARAGNVIGGGDWAADRLVPDIARSILTRSTLRIRYPNASRPWQHVLEPLYGYLQLAQFLFLYPNDYAQAWNFGPDENEVKSVDWIIQEIQLLWGETLNVQYERTPKLHEASLLKLDSSKAKISLNWKPSWNLETALRHTVDWYRAYQENKDMYIKTKNQINQYISDRLSV